MRRWLPCRTIGRRTRVSTPYPQLRRYGILDEEDLNAWKKVEGPFRDMGFTLIRQLGIGQFGRVYEACNQFNPHIPRHVAIKIDRIVRGKKKEAIQSAEATMRIGEDLSTAPHVIRVFDAGKLKGKRYTYHVLQMVDGDTLDNLVGISGIEHSSMLRATDRETIGTRGPAGLSQGDQSIHARGLATPTHDAPVRRPARPLPDTRPVDQRPVVAGRNPPTQLCRQRSEERKSDDQPTRSIQGHRPGCVQSASPIRWTELPTSSSWPSRCVLLLLNVNKSRDEPMASCEGLLQSRDTLLGALTEAWPFEDVANISNGRVETRRDDRIAGRPDRTQPQPSLRARPRSLLARYRPTHLSEADDFRDRDRARLRPEGELTSVISGFR